MKFEKMAVALAALVCAAPLQAHHSISLFDIAAPIWIKGTVTSYQVRNPHVMMNLDVKGEDGQVRQLIVEGPNLLRHTRMGADEKFLQPGDVVEVCGFPFKDSVVATAKAALPAMHGHVVKRPDGKMRLWGPYGKLVNCVRPNDKAETWVVFLDADPFGHDAWCIGQTYTNVALLPSKEAVELINSRLATKCQ